MTKNGWVKDPTVNNKIYKYLFSVIDKVLKINDNNIHDVKFINRLIEELYSIEDKLDDDPDRLIVPTNSRVGVNVLIRAMTNLLGNRYKNDIKKHEEYLLKLSENQVISKLKEESIEVVEQKFVSENIFCTSCPYEWLRFSELDMNDVNKKRETIIEIDKNIEKQSKQIDVFDKRIEPLKDKVKKIESNIEKTKREKDARQNEYNKTKERNLKDIKTLSGKNGYEKLYKQIKNS